MNEQLQTALAEILISTTQGVKEGVAFLQAELPEVVSQLLVFKFWWAVVELAMFLVLAFGATKFLRNTLKLYKENAWKYEARLFGASILMVFFGACAVIASFINVKTILLIQLAPKLYLIEYATKLVGGK